MFAGDNAVSCILHIGLKYKQQQALRETKEGQFVESPSHVVSMEVLSVSGREH